MAHKRLSSRQSEWQAKQENLLIAIDQLEQLTEVMSEVLTRVKHQVNNLETHLGSTTDITRKSVSHKKTKADSTSKTKKRSIVH